MRHTKKNSMFIIALIIGILYIVFSITDTIHASVIVANANKEILKDMTPLYLIIGIVGGVIAITLSYVGYRKYKAEEKKRNDNGHDS